MGWLEIVKTIADFGIMVIVAALFLWQVHDMYNKKNKKDAAVSSRVREMEDKRQNRYDELLDNLEKKTDDLYNLIIEESKHNEEKYQDILNQFLDELRKPHILTQEENSRMTKIDAEIDFLLEKALNANQASRVHLVKYHNGGNDMLGNSILKMSMSNEKCAAGVTHLMNSFQNQLRSAFTYWIKELNEKGFCYIENIEDMNGLDNSIYQYMKQSGISAKYGIAIKNYKTDAVIGYLCIDFANKDSVNSKQVEECLKDKKNKIETLLNL